MSDWMANALEMQREMLRAQKAQMKAARTAMESAERMMVLQEAGQKAAEANLAMWNQWAKLWGWK